MPPSKTKPSTELEWKPFEPAAYAAAISDMAHFSFKSANSNAAAGGIRLSPDSALRLPYVSLRTLQGAGKAVEIDYLKNVGSTATITKQVRLALDLHPEVPPHERDAIAGSYKAAQTTRMESGTASVSPRLRHVLIPKPGTEGEYVALTPLSAAGTATLIRSFVTAHNERWSDKSEKEFRAKHRRIATATMGFGGSNRQNVGALIRYLQTLVVVTAPRERPQIRAAFALFHRGPELRLDHKLMQQYADWLKSLQTRFERGEVVSAEDRIAERELVQFVARTALDQARRRCAILYDWRYAMPGAGSGEDPSMFDANVSPLLKGIVEPRWRKSDWPRRMAEHIAGLIVSYRFKDGALLPMNAGDQSFVVGQIEEMLCTY